MKKLSGLVLDRYDLDAEVRRYFCNTRPGYEELEKTAHRFTYDELAALPDETFAVILEDSGTTLKKFSMADAGNLALSIEHFMVFGHKLPEEAQKVAAANLLRGCQWYGLVPEPETGDQLQKIAIGLMNLALSASMAPGAVREAKNNLAVAKANGPAIMTPDQIKGRRLQMGV
jgi:hypothetical protein